MRGIAATIVIVIGCVLQVALWTVVMFAAFLSNMGDCLDPNDCPHRGPLPALGIGLIISVLLAIAMGYGVRKLNGPDE